MMLTYGHPSSHLEFVHNPSRRIFATYLTHLHGRITCNSLICDFSFENQSARFPGEYLSQTSYITFISRLMLSSIHIADDKICDNKQGQRVVVWEKAFKWQPSYC